MSIILFIIILLVLVLVHEFGHFISAKRFDIRVDEFGFGFPPRAMKLFKRGETLFTLNWLPIGGFVKIFGENPNEESIKGPHAKRSFVNKPKWQQAIVLFAGVFANFLLAWILFSIVFMVGSPLATDSIPSGVKAKMKESSVVLGVLPNSPAEKAGVKIGDVVLSLESPYDKIENPSLEDFMAFSNKPNESITISYLRKNKPQSVDIIPEYNKEINRAIMGISPGTLISGRFGPLESIKYGLETTLISSRDTIVAFGKLFQRGEEAQAVRESVVGPVGLVRVTGFVSEIGFGYLLSFVALISVSLAIINLVPFPALDGGRLLFLLIEKIKGSRLNPKIANYANTAGFVLLLLLMAVVTYHDIVRLL